MILFSSLRRVEGGVRRRARSMRYLFGSGATDCRLLADHSAKLGEYVAVVGDPLAVRKALKNVHLDIISSNPFDRTVTVLSNTIGPKSLPVARWSAVVLMDPHPLRLKALIEAASPACQVDGVVVILGERGDESLNATHVRGRRRLTIIRVSSGYKIE